VIKKRDREAQQYHKYIIEQHKREDLLGQMREQEVDAENVRRMKEELRVDQANRANRALLMRRSVEQDWVCAHREKRERDDNERAHRMGVDGELVHEQCDKYRKCAQCKRDLSNVGVSNILKDTRYIAGSRIMA